MFDKVIPVILSPAQLSELPALAAKLVLFVLAALIVVIIGFFIFVTLVNLIYSKSLHRKSANAPSRTSAVLPTKRNYHFNLENTDPDDVAYW
jgi:Na+-translocating ferredoxin:NAD+ oxidoreductase RnfD subunit